MHTAEKENTELKQNSNIPSFSTDLHSEIDLRASQNSSPQRNTNRFYYTVGAFNILLEQKIKAENLPLLTINKIPHAPKWCKGMINIRGIIIPVVDMHIFLKTGIDTSKHKSKLLMLQLKDHDPIIFQIDKLPEIVNTEDFAYSKAPENSPTWLKNTLKSEQNSIYEINHADFFKQLRQSQQ